MYPPEPNHWYVSVKTKKEKHTKIKLGATLWNQDLKLKQVAER
jgi:hypothetical protein